ncbi:hypothetical protein FSP39_019004 [Pinctada imbricata]|uniref:Uncharacterized protein n=1 Tax=Pinctada imbricata TaxID=66713 RepID=A0AA88YEQ3_PINIB|nr:hypothetical protein FSP39_019004 [Pinctada imbricata]
MYTDGKSQSLYSTSPLSPTGICESRDGGLLVCLVECDHSKITSTTKGEVHQIDMKGKIIRKYTNDCKDQSKLFTYPNRVAINVNSDLCVVDILNKDLSCRVIAVAMDSKIHFTYKGQPSLGQKFFASDIMCDFWGRIILSDFFNSAVHVLSADGVFLQFLITADDGLSRPHSITLYADKLWVGCAKGVIKLYELNFP